MAHADSTTGDQAPDGGPLVIDSGPLVMQATTQPNQQDEEVHDVGDRPGTGE